MPAGIDDAAAIGGILQFSIQLAKLCKNYYRSFRNARKELERLGQPVMLFSRVLYHLWDSIYVMHQQNIKFAQDDEMKRTIIHVSKVVKERMCHIEQAFKRLSALRDHKSSRKSRIFARLMWIISDERDLKELLASFEPIKSSIFLLATLFDLNVLIFKVVESRQTGRDIEEQDLTNM